MCKVLDIHIINICSPDKVGISYGKYGHGRFKQISIRNFHEHTEVIRSQIIWSAKYPIKQNVPNHNYHEIYIAWMIPSVLVEYSMAL